MCITTTSNKNRRTDTMDLTWLHIILSDLKPDIWDPSHTSSQLFHSYIYIYHLWSHIPTISHIRRKLFPIIAQVVCSFSTLIPKFIHLFCHTHKDRVLLGYPNQESQRKIPSSTISNEIPSIVFLLIFYRYLFILSILISKFKIIAANKYFLESSHNLFLKLNSNYL